MNSFRLWSDEIEAMRPEARKVVAEGFAAFSELLGREATPPEDRYERARQQRESHAKNFHISPDVMEREIAGVRCRVATPDGAARAVYLHFHGGGMVAGAPEMMDLGSVHLARTYDVAVVSVDYRKAPEHPYPAGPDDGVAVAAWLLERAESEFGSGRLFTGGESAGGYMTAAVLLRIRDELDAIDRVIGANLVFGVYDLSGAPAFRGARPSDVPDILEDGLGEFVNACFVPGLTPDDCKVPSISPLYAELHDLPPALFTVGSADHLLDDSLFMAARWEVFGNDTELAVYPDCIHAFNAFPTELAKRANERIDAFFERVLG